jgi:multiple sugar transport system substrate-binding protein
MLSEEMQKTRDLGGFAVNKKASLARQEQLKEIGAGNGKMQMKLMNKDGTELKLRTPEQHEIDRIEKALTNVKHYAETDPKVIAIIEQETASYFTGQKSAEDAAKSVQNKINTYLQE